MFSPNVWLPWFWLLSPWKAIIFLWASTHHGLYFKMCWIASSSKKSALGKKKVICYLFQFVFYVGVYICIYISLSLSLYIYIYQCTQYIPNFAPGHFPKLRNITLKNNNKPDHYLFFKRYYKIVFFFLNFSTFPRLARNLEN